MSNDVTYEGEIDSPSKNFKSFENIYGWRAMIELLRAYYKNDSCRTLEQMIQRYAPTGDGKNDPTAYAQTVANASGIDIDTDMGNILYSPQIVSVIQAMAQVEQGSSVMAQVDTSGAQQAYNIA